MHEVITVKQTDHLEKEPVKQPTNYNYNQQSHFIGFRCPNDLFNSLLNGKNYTKTIVEILSSYSSSNQEDLAVKQAVKQSDISTLIACILEFNKLMAKARPEIPNDINKEIIREGVKLCLKVKKT